MLQKLYCVMFLTLGMGLQACSSQDESSSLNFFHDELEGSPIAPRYNGADNSWDCGYFKLSSVQVKSRLDNARNLPLFYSDDTINRIAKNPCVMTTEASHRGDVDFAPQNTLPAINLAVDHGARFIEIDVYLNANNAPIVLHDSNYVKERPLVPSGFNQVSGPTEACYGKNFETDDWKVMKTCDVSRNNPDYDMERVPLLREVLAAYGDTDAIFLVEMKRSRNMNRLGQRVSQLLMKYVPNPSQRWVTSFEEEALDAVDPEINKVRVVRIDHVGLALKNIIADGTDKGYDMFVTDISSLNEEMVAFAADYGAGYGAYTLTKTKPYHHYAALRVGGAIHITDRLKDFRKLIGVD